MNIPASVLDAYGFSTNCIEAVSGGLINATYCVHGGEANQAIAAVQRLHSVFSPEVNLDLEVVTDHVAGKGMMTPRLIRTQAGEAWVAVDGEIWRAITWVSGNCHQRIPSLSVASAAAELVARFHTAVADLEYEFQSSRTGVHDTAAHLLRLRQARTSNSDALTSDATSLRSEILRQVAALPPMAPLPLRVSHGDLKVSNLLFNDEDRGLALIDLDTLGRQTVAFELGDALRSWANPTGEDVPEPEIDIEIVKAAGEGYAAGAGGLLSAREVGSVIIGLQTVCIELAARFCCDIFDDSYFGWDPKRFESRREHNLVRGQGQLALGKSVAQQYKALTAAWSDVF